MDCRVCVAGPPYGLAMEKITYLIEVLTGEICSICECEMTVSPAAAGGSELSCDCTSYLVA